MTSNKSRTGGMVASVISWGVIGLALYFWPTLWGWVKMSLGMSVQMWAHDVCSLMYAPGEDMMACGWGGIFILALIIMFLIGMIVMIIRR